MIHKGNWVIKANYKMVLFLMGVIASTFPEHRHNNIYTFLFYIKETVGLENAYYFELK